MIQIISYILKSENRNRIMQTLIAYPKRQWSASAVEDFTKISHATVFRTLQSFAGFGLIKPIKVNRRDIIFELVTDSPYLKEITRVMEAENHANSSMMEEIVDVTAPLNPKTIILYGSYAKGNNSLDSDIDILFIAKEKETKKITDAIASLSSRINKTISPIIIDIDELYSLLKKKDRFILSIKNDHKVLYGKDPF